MITPQEQIRERWAGPLRLMVFLACAMACLTESYVDPRIVLLLAFLGAEFGYQIRASGLSGSIHPDQIPRRRHFIITLLAAAIMLTLAWEIIHSAGRLTPVQWFTWFVARLTPPSLLLMVAARRPLTELTTQ